MHFCAMVITTNELQNTRLAKVYADMGFITTNDVQYCVNKENPKIKACQINMISVDLN